MVGVIFSIIYSVFALLLIVFFWLLDDGFCVYFLVFFFASFVSGPFN